MPRHVRDPKLEQFWRTTLASWARSGLNVRDFCRVHDLKEGSFYSWRRIIAARDQHSNVQADPRPQPNPAAPRRATPTRAAQAEPDRRAATPAPPTFVPVRVIADTPLELVLRSGRILRVPHGCDPEHLLAVVAALEGASC